MKYTTEVIINLPRQRVIELFDNAENMKKWQPELISFEQLSGEPGQPGAQSKLLYKMGKRETEMIETITTRNFPDEFHGTYEANGVLNIQKNFFKTTPDGQTKWISESEFKLKGMMWLMGLLMPGAFKKQSLKFMQNFKEFAEGEKELNDA